MMTVVPKLKLIDRNVLWIRTKLVLSVILSRKNEKSFDFILPKEKGTCQKVGKF